MASPLKFGLYGKSGEGKDEARVTSPSARGRSEQKSCLTRCRNTFNIYSVWFRPYLAPVVKLANIISSSLAFFPDLVSGYASTISGVSLLSTHWVEHSDRVKERVKLTELRKDYNTLTTEYKYISFQPLQLSSGYGVIDNWTTRRILSMVISLFCAGAANGYLAYTGFNKDYENDALKIICLTASISGSTLHFLDEHIKKVSIGREQDYYRKAINMAKDKIIKFQKEELEKERVKSADMQVELMAKETALAQLKEQLDLVKLPSEEKQLTLLKDRSSSSSTSISSLPAITFSTVSVPTTAIAKQSSLPSIISSPTTAGLLATSLVSALTNSNTANSSTIRTGVMAKVQLHR